MQPDSEWMSGPDVWCHFIEQHPELGYRPGRMNFHNFLRYYRADLIAADAIRFAKRRFWIAHRQRFCDAAFACATAQLPGKEPKPASAYSTAVLVR